MTTSDLIFMMFNDEPIETFAKLLEADNPALKWGQLLDMCYCEKGYEGVGGDYGDMDNPPINYERLEYLEKLIAFLEEKGIVAEKP